MTTHDPAYLQLTNKLQTLLTLFTSHVTKPAELLVKELVLDQEFVDGLLNYSTTGIQKEDLNLGYVLLLLSATRALKQNNMVLLEAKKIALFDKIFHCVSSSQVWCMLDLRINFEDDKAQSFGLLEFLFIHVVDLAVTFDAKQYCHLERKLFEATLGTECMSAIFASNLWVALARKSNHLLISEQVCTLCTIYQKLEQHKLFQHSPQETHLRHTITNLFKTIGHEERLMIVQKFNVCDDRNSSIWNVLKINNMPDVVRRKAEKTVGLKLKSKLEMLLSVDAMSVEDFCVLVDTIKLASSCSSDFGPNIQALLVNSWLKACPTNNFINLSQYIDRGQMWYFNFVSALIYFTRQNKNIFSNDNYLMQVLHVICNIIDTGNIELSLLCINLIIDILRHGVKDGTIISDQIRTIISGLLRSEVTSKTLYYKLKERKEECLILNLANEDTELFEEWAKVDDLNSKNNMDLKESLVLVDDNQFQHKCVSIGHKEINSKDVMLGKKCSSNFDFADVDSLFDIEESEPDSKKLKLQREEFESIIARLESDTHMLSKIGKHLVNADNKETIKNICYKLNSLIH